MRWPAVPQRTDIRIPLNYEGWVRQISGTKKTSEKTKTQNKTIIPRKANSGKKQALGKRANQRLFGDIKTHRGSAIRSAGILRTYSQLFI